MPRYLTEADVERLADMDLALRTVEASFERQGRGAASNVGRRRARTARGALQLMGAADPELGAMGAKLYPSIPGGRISFVVVLFDAASGALSAVIEAGRLSGLRTGAASAVSVKHLAPPDVRGDRADWHGPAGAHAARSGLHGAAVGAGAGVLARSGERAAFHR